jgi:hypothetical protein
MPTMPTVPTVPALDPRLTLAALGLGAAGLLLGMAALVVAALR